MRLLSRESVPTPMDAQSHLSSEVTAKDVNMTECVRIPMRTDISLCVMHSMTLSVLPPDPEVRCQHQSISWHRWG